MEHQSTQHQLEKQGSLLGLLGFGAAMHVTPNIAMKAVKSTDKGHRALTNTFAAGLEHGKTGQKLQHNWDSAMTYGIGPESLVEYRLGRKLGDKLSKYPPEIQEKYMSIMERNINARFNQLPVDQQKALMHAPLIGTAKRYFEGEGDGKIKDFLVKRGVPADQAPSKLNRLVDVGMLGGAAAVDPHLLVQPAISMARKKTAESEFGRRFMKQQFQNGEQGVGLSKAKEFATDMLISPGALDPYRVGRAMNQTLEAPDRERLKVVGDELFSANKKLKASPQSNHKKSLAGDAGSLLGQVNTNRLKERLGNIEGGKLGPDYKPPTPLNA